MLKWLIAEGKMSQEGEGRLTTYLRDLKKVLKLRLGLIYLYFCP